MLLLLMMMMMMMMMLAGTRMPKVFVKVTSLPAQQTCLAAESRWRDLSTDPKSSRWVDDKAGQGGKPVYHGVLVLSTFGPEPVVSSVACFP